MCSLFSNKSNINFHYFFYNNFTIYFVIICSSILVLLIVFFVEIQLFYFVLIFFILIISKKKFLKKKLLKTAGRLTPKHMNYFSILVFCFFSSVNPFIYLYCSNSRTFVYCLETSKAV